PLRSRTICEDYSHEGERSGGRTYLPTGHRPNRPSLRPRPRPSIADRAMTALNYLKDLTAPQTRDLSDSQMSSLEAKLVKALTGPGPAGLGLQVVVGAWNGQSAPIAEARKIHAERQIGRAAWREKR